MTRERRDERGSAVAETAIGVFAAIMMVSLVVYAGRLTVAGNDIRTAAHEGVRAASVAANLGEGQAAADRVARENIATVSCANGLSIITTGDFVPGGFVTVTIDCTAPLGELLWLPVPGSQQLSYSSTEVIDTFRADPE